jgi:hypothetical protein
VSERTPTTPPAPAPLLLTLADAGNVLACSASTVRNLIARGDLRAVHLAPVKERTITRAGKQIVQHHGGAVRVALTDIETFIRKQAPAQAVTP